MGYTLPTFNLDVNIFTGGVVTVPPRLTVKGNLALGRRIQLAMGIPGDTDGPSISMTLLLPPGTDIRDSLNVGTADVVEVPAGTQRFYMVTTVDDIGKGFPNEHRYAMLVKTVPSPLGAWPTPIP